MPNPDGGGSTVVLKVDNSIPASENNEFCKSLFLLIAASGGREEINKTEKWILIKAMESHKVTAREAHQAFWEAVSDPYVSRDTGIQFRHMWKHIEKERGQSVANYTYEEVLNKMDKEKIPMECFAMIEERDGRGRKKWVLK